MKIRNLNSWIDGTILLSINGVEYEISHGEEIEVTFQPRSKKLSVFQEDPFSAEGAMNIVRQANKLAYQKEVEGVVKQATEEVSDEEVEALDKIVRHMDFGESDKDYDNKLQSALDK